MEKVRLDNLIYQKGLAESREKARAFVLAGLVKIDGKIVDKAGTKLKENVLIEISDNGLKYVSRGGLKLEKAIIDFQVDFKQKVVLDVGASTGGYTDCALQNGALKVYAVDVGYGQLHWKLRTDPRVHNRERTNIRYFSLNDLGEKVDIITVDISFISINKVIHVLYEFLKEDGQIIALIKPQFEAGKEQVGRNGVVRDSKIHRELLERCIRKAGECGLICEEITYSPIKGPKGNIEYFINLKIKGIEIENVEEKISQVVDSAHHNLGEKNNENSPFN